MKFDKVKTADCLRKTRLEVDAEGDSSPEPDVTVPEYEPPTAESVNCGDELFAYMVGKCYSETDAAALCNEIPDITGITITPNRTITSFENGDTTTQGTPVYADGATVEEGKKITFKIKVNFKYGEETREVDASELIPIQDANGEDFYSVSYSLSSDSPLLTNPNPNNRRGSPAKFNAGQVTTDTVVNVHAVLALTCTGGPSPVRVAEFRQSVKVTIKEDCQRIGSDIVLVVDRSGSMMRKDGTDRTRLEGAKAACSACIESANWPYIATDDWNEDSWDEVDAVLASNKEYDRVAIVSYAGNSKESYSDWTEIRDFTYIKEEALGGVAELQVSQECGGLAPEGVETCSTGIGGGLSYAHDILKRDPRTGKRRVIILITDGYENVCEPGYEPETIAAAIKGDSTSAAADTVIVAIGFRTQATRKVRKCDDSVLTVESYLKTSIATCELYFDAQSTGELENILYQIHTIICEAAAAGNTSCLGKDYNITTPTVVTDNPCVDARRNYRSFNKWNVCKGWVDIMGGDIWGSLFQTSSQWVGLIGSRGTLRTFPAKKKSPLRACQQFWGQWDKQFGGIETNENNKVTLEVGKNYELTVILGGNNAVSFTPGPGNKLCSSVRVSVGGTQAGHLDPPYYQSSPDVNGTIDGGFRDDGAEKQDGSGDIPVLCTRKLINPVAQAVYTVPPKGNNLIPYTLKFSGTGVTSCIRVEQYPLGWGTNEYTYPVPDSVWKNHCSLKSVDVSVRDYGGFWTDNGFIDPLSDTSEKLRFQTSGADFFIAPPAYGVCLTNVLLEEVAITEVIEQTCTLTTDSASVTVQDATKLSVGQRVKTSLKQGIHLEPQTTVATIVGATTITISSVAKLGIATKLTFTTQVRTTVFEDSFAEEGLC